MAAKKFSLKDNPIFESTTIPIKKDREKHPLNAIYSPSEKVKRKAGNKSPVFTDKIREWSAKKIDKKVLSLGVIALIIIPSFFIYSWWREVLKMDHPAPLATEVKPLIAEVDIQKPEELLPEEAPLIIEALPLTCEEKELLTPPPRRLREERWLLSAIIFDGANSHALINRRIVRKGDTLQEGKVKVIEITPDSVVLVRGEEKFTIRLESNSR